MEVYCGDHILSSLNNIAGKSLTNFMMHIQEWPKWKYWQGCCVVARTWQRYWEKSICVCHLCRLPRILLSHLCIDWHVPGLEFSMTMHKPLWQNDSYCCGFSLGWSISCYFSYMPAKITKPCTLFCPKLDCLRLYLTSDEFLVFTQKNGIWQSNSAAYHPSINGLANKQHKC